MYRFLVGERKSSLGRLGATRSPTDCLFASFGRLPELALSLGIAQAKVDNPCALNVFAQ